MMKGPGPRGPRGAMPKGSMKGQGKLLLRLLNKVTKIPVLKQVNGILGFLLGIGKGIIIVWMLCALVSIIVPLFGPSAQWAQDAMDHSYVFRALANFNIVSIWLL